MTSDGRKIDVKTVEKYLRALMESYIIYQAKRYNVRGKTISQNPGKNIIVDIGMRYMLLGSRSTDVGHILKMWYTWSFYAEAMMFLWVKVDELEVDFVAMEPKKTIYYQVAASVRDETTLKRELTPLQKITDHYPKNHTDA